MTTQNTPTANADLLGTPRSGPGSVGSAGYSEHDAERWLPEEHSSRRSDFARDRARLLHSSALRRLAAKTQVLSPTAGLDFARNRLTHSLEVAQVGRELATSLGLDPDVVDTACLAHDLGHPPFGHNGEKALNDWCDRHRRLRGQRADAATAHAASSPRSSAPTASSYGLNLTRASLDASCKYPWPAAAGHPRSRRSQQVRLLRRRHPGLRVAARRRATTPAVHRGPGDGPQRRHRLLGARLRGRRRQRLHRRRGAVGARSTTTRSIDAMHAWVGGELSRDELTEAFDRLAVARRLARRLRRRPGRRRLG